MANRQQKRTALDLVQSVATLPATRTQLDLLGERIRKGPLVADDLALLSAFRDSFELPLRDVQSILTRMCIRRLGGAPSTKGYPLTVRPAKSTRAIVAKLRRSPGRLTQIQDIAGMRLTVPDFADQDRLEAAIRKEQRSWRVTSLTKRPSNGYRAVHAVAVISGVPIEVQIRTRLQDTWAQMCEGLDRSFPGLKYGSGPPGLQALMTEMATADDETERLMGELSTQSQARRETRAGRAPRSVLNSGEWELTVRRMDANHARQLQLMDQVREWFPRPKAASS
jgi:ppGpp synthetase/RelA/SpoT-type nucleotidyltranferase